MTIQNFDFDGRAVGELTSLDEMRLNMTERWVSHFHDELINKYQGQGSTKLLVTDCGFEQPVNP